MNICYYDILMGLDIDVNRDNVEQIILDNIQCCYLTLNTHANLQHIITIQ